MSTPALPRIVSTTLFSNDEAALEGALASVVGWVHKMLLIDTGSQDASLNVAQRIAGDKLIYRRFAWVEDFAAARNFALDAAHAAGGDWALTLDADERIELNGDDLAGALSDDRVRVVLFPSDGSGYLKERLFRLPATERWHGVTHERFPTHRLPIATLGRARFRELPKSGEQIRSKLARDVLALTRMVEIEPDESRWHYYLADTLQNLGRFQEAVAAYSRCVALRQWEEQDAWASYRSGECWLSLGRPDDAIDACALGLARHAGVAELAWLAGFASWTARRPEQAAHWSRIAIAMGLFRGKGHAVFRGGFRNLSALYEGPFDVLRFALKAMGDDAGAAEAERDYHAAIVARIGRP